MTASPLSPSDDPQLADWRAIHTPKLSAVERDALHRAQDFSWPRYAGKHLLGGELLSSHVLGMAERLIALHVDHEALAAATLCALPELADNANAAAAKKMGDEITATFSAGVWSLVSNVVRIDKVGAQAGRDIAADKKAQPQHPAHHQSHLQAEALRKMLLAMAEDIRAVVISLADRAQTLSYVARSEFEEAAEVARNTGDAANTARIARAAMDIYAPLANRLGLGQIKRELEDLSFQLLEPERYRNIANLLDARREDRERYIDDVLVVLKQALAEAGIRAEVAGRPKHIYSIAKKMQIKDKDFSQIRDLQAVRVLVGDVKDCYATLGVVHQMWMPLEGEFDDYIAKPKANGYRSLHTAVRGPGNQVVEVQIRTHDMHQSSELGVAAHWRYKEAAKAGARHDHEIDEKIGWLRQMLAWKEDVANVANSAVDGAAATLQPPPVADQFKTTFFDDRVYVLTPEGRVVDLPQGATPVDFAYQLHTDLGHRCRGAKVDGVMVPLSYGLQNLQRVEIVTAKQGSPQGPSRDWLNPNLGFIKSHRARAKVRQWFNALEHVEELARGRSIVEKELQRHGMTALALEKFAAKFKPVKIDKLDDFFAAVARGDINQRQLGAALSGEDPAPAPIEAALRIKKTSASGGGILIVGVDKLLTVLAKCCKPAPPDAIIGFVTRGRGVSIHRQNCATLSRLSDESRERLIAAEWGATDTAKMGSFPVDVEIVAADRQGLLRDISEILSREKINVTATNTQSRDDTAYMHLTVMVFDLEQLRRALGLLKEVSGVMSATRK